MTDEKKISRWTKTLHKAGLIGEVEDAWTLPEHGPKEAPVIVVKNLREDDQGERQEKRPTATTADDDKAPLSALHKMMRERIEMGDHSGGLEIAEQILAAAPEDSEAAGVRLNCRKTLMQMYESRIGSFQRAPKRIISEEEIVWRNLDPVAGFIAASADGTVSFEDIIDISTLSRFDACRVLNQLLQDGIIQ
jgi:hypothetical protein